MGLELVSDVRPASEIRGRVARLTRAVGRIDDIALRAIDDGDRDLMVRALAMLNTYRARIDELNWVLER